MKILIVTLVACICVLLVGGDASHVKATKAKVLGRLIKGKHHKRGILTGIPPYKLGHDIPLVTHSVVKPLVVTYPPTATVAAVKVPLTNPLISQYPVGVGHKVPVPHPHYGLKFPQTKVILPKPDHHFHHHHHHVAPKPVVPIVPVAPPVPVPQPTPVVAHAIPEPAPPVFVPAPIIPAPPAHTHQIQLTPTPAFQSHPLPLAPPPVQILPPSHFHLKPQLSAATIPFPPAQSFSSPAIPQIPYVLRPGGSVQTSVFSTFPRYPLYNYQSPLIPLSSTLSAGHVQQVLLERPQLPHYHFIPQASGHSGVLEQHIPNIALDQTPNLVHPTNVAPPSVIPLNPPHELPQPGVQLHPTQAAFPQHEIPLHPTQAVFPQHEIPLHPTQAAIPQPAVHLQPTQTSVHLDHDGWSPVPSQPHDVPSVQIPEAQLPQQGHQFTQEQGTQVYEQHTEDQYLDFQQQLQHHIQQQIEQAQYEQHLNNQHQLGQEYGVPQQIGQEYGQPNEYYHQNQDFASQQGQDFSQQGQDLSQQGQTFAHQGQDFGQHGQDFPPNDYNLAQPGQEYGVPQQGLEGRSGDQGDQNDQGQQQFHNHIPLGLQPPIDRPLEHFR